MEKRQIQFDKLSFINVFGKYFEGLDQNQKSILLGTSKKLNPKDYRLDFRVKFLIN